MKERLCENTPALFAKRKHLFLFLRCLLQINHDRAVLRTPCEMLLFVFCRLNGDFFSVKLN